MRAKNDASAMAGGGVRGHETSNRHLSALPTRPVKSGEVTYGASDSAHRRTVLNDEAEVGVPLSDDERDGADPAAHVDHDRVAGELFPREACALARSANGVTSLCESESLRARERRRGQLNTGMLPRAQVPGRARELGRRKDADRANARVNETSANAMGG